MLILERKPGESVIITTEKGEVIKVHISKKSRGSSVVVGVDAPRSITIDREEVHLRKLAEGEKK